MYKNLNFIAIIYNATQQYSSSPAAPAYGERLRPQQQIKVHFSHKHIA